MLPRALVLVGVLLSLALVYSNKEMYRPAPVVVAPVQDPPYVILVAWCDTPATGIIIPQPGVPYTLLPEDVVMTDEFAAAVMAERHMVLEICYEEVKT